MTDYKNNIPTSGYCYIFVKTLVSENYLSADEAKDFDGNEMGGAVKYNIGDSTYSYELNDDNYNKCVNP